MKKRRIFAFILIVVMIITLPACNNAEEAVADLTAGKITLADSHADSDGSNTGNTLSGTAGAASDPERSTGMTVNPDGSLAITRMSRPASTKMGEESTWTIFVYMCGTDLESDGSGMATMDLRQMLEARGSDNVKFVVQTGGTNSWANDTIDSTKLQRYVIQNQKMYLVDEQPLSDMGSADALANFLSWGVKNHPAGKMGVIFWNHGGGSISGVCFDEMSRDSLSLTEIERAFTSVYKDMTDSFEFVGFDACLMGTLETANILAPHARYMIGSQELEPGFGWDYTAIGSYLAQNPSANGAALGKVVADSFYESCAAIESESDTTISCIDLSKVDDLIVRFNTVAQSMYTSSNDTRILSEMVRGILAAENYGGNNRSEGYTNMVDLGCILENISEFVDEEEEALEALDNCVIYMRNGSNKAESRGLSLYYPLSIQGSMELSIFKDICVSPYYMSFVDKLAYAAGTNGMLDEYNGDIWFGENSDYWWSSYDETPEEGFDYWSYLEDNTAGYNFDTENSSVSFAQTPLLDDSGNFSFVISEDTLNNVASVMCSIFLAGADEDTFIDLGLDDNVFFNRDTGTVTDNFSGFWFALPDGQPLATYIVEQAREYNIYTSPVFLNGVRTNLRIRMNYVDDKNYSMEIIGAWEGIDELTGEAAREIVKLKRGDIITPRYYTFTQSTGIVDEYCGEEYIFSNNTEIIEDYLFVGDYYYSFLISDIFGKSLYTDCAVFTINENGEINFETE